MTPMVNTAGAIFNVLNSPHSHGRVTFLSSYFDIPRPSIYRLCNQFTEQFCQGPGRPQKTDEQRQIESLQKQVNQLTKDSERLNEELEKQKQVQQICVERLKFTLICLGMSARDIVDVTMQVFGIKTSHTSILKLMRLYAKRASEIMKECFWPAAIDVDIDEVFIENDPLYQ